MPEISLLEHHLPSIAERIHALQAVSYRQEARLLGLARFPPLERTAEDIRRSGEVFLGATNGQELLGVASYEHQAQVAVLISSLTVAPMHQRKGIGRALVAAIQRAQPWEIMAVSTAAGNSPAIALYLKLGFVERSRRFVNSGQLELVELVKILGAHG